MSNSIEKQLNNPFYKKVEKIRNEVKMQQLEKAVDKYPEPFNPRSWTGRQLVEHALQENYDQLNYIVGLYDRIEMQDELITDLEADVCKLDNYLTDGRIDLARSQIYFIIKTLQKLRA